MGISFAIPIDLAMSVVEQLKIKGKVSRGQLGINIQEVTQELSESFGLHPPRGALVVRVDPKGPASRAGLQAGDIILKFNGKQIGSSKHLPAWVGSLQPGTKIRLSVWRKGVEKEFEATLAELGQDAPGAEHVQEEPMTQGFQLGKIGLTLSALTAAQCSELGVRGGLLIHKARGAAARSGLQTGDVILGLNQHQVLSIASFEKALTKTKGHIALLVRRDEAVLFVPLRLE